MAKSPNSSTDPQPEPAHEEQEAEPVSFGQRWSELLIAAVVIALGVVVLVESHDIRLAPFATVSPRLIPRVIGVGLITVGLWYALEIVRNPQTGHGEESEDIDPEATTDWSVIAFIGFGLLCYALLMEYAGFIIASAVLFFISARSMGSRRVPRDLTVAVLISVAIFLLFDTWLGVRLPAGELAEWLSREL